VWGVRNGFFGGGGVGPEAQKMHMTVMNFVDASCLVPACILVLLPACILVLHVHLSYCLSCVCTCPSACMYSCPNKLDV